MSVSEEATTPAPAAAAPTAAAAAFERGKTLFDAGNVLGSLTEFDTALDLDDANAIYYVSRAAAFLATDRASDALADAKTALQLLEGGGGGVTTGSTSGGVSKQQQQEQQEDANDSANDAIINSNAAGVTASAQYQVGAALYALKDYSGARSAYASALMLLHDGNAAVAAAAAAAATAVVDVSIAAKEGLAKCNSELGLPADSTPDLKPATTTTTIATAAGSGSSYAPMPVVKRDWYQSATHVVVTFGLRNLAGKDAVETESVDDGCAVSIKAILPSGQAYTATIGPLWGTIVPQETSVRVSKAKIEVRLKKADAIRWSSLEGAVGAVVSSTSATASVQGETPPQQQAAAAAAAAVSSRTAVRMALPSEVEKATTERKTGRDWDKIVTEIKKEEKEEKPEGEAALNQLFQQIYGDGNEDTKRAMMKSYIESNGTVLSTNWDEVKQGKVETKPPEGMEYKKYEQ